MPQPKDKLNTDNPPNPPPSRIYRNERHISKIKCSYCGSECSIKEKICKSCGAKFV